MIIIRIPFPNIRFSFRKLWDKYTDNNWAFVGREYDPFYGIKGHIKDILHIECWDHYPILRKWRVLHEERDGRSRHVTYFCPRCKEQQVVTFTTGYPEYVPESTKESRKEYAKSTLQPFRGGEFSQEFAQAYPERTQQMLKEGTITKKDIKNAKAIWKDTLPTSWQKSK